MYRILIWSIVCLQSFQSKIHHIISLMCLIVCRNYTNDESKKQENQSRCKFNLRTKYQNPLISKTFSFVGHRLISKLDTFLGPSNKSNKWYVLHTKGDQKASPFNKIIDNKYQYAQLCGQNLLIWNDTLYSFSHISDDGLCLNCLAELKKSINWQAIKWSNLWTI